PTSLSSSSSCYAWPITRAHCRDSQWDAQHSASCPCSMSSSATTHESAYQAASGAQRCTASGVGSQTLLPSATILAVMRKWSDTRCPAPSQAVRAFLMTGSNRRQLFYSSAGASSRANQYAPCSSTCMIRSNAEADGKGGKAGGKFDVATVHSPLTWSEYAATISCERLWRCINSRKGHDEPRIERLSDIVVSTGS